MLEAMLSASELVNLGCFAIDPIAIRERPKITIHSMSHLQMGC